MYSAGLNLTQLNEYLVSLSQLGMLALGQDRVYLTTEKGRQFVKAYERYSETRDLLTEQEKILYELWSPAGRKAPRLEGFAQLRT